MEKSRKINFRFNILTMIVYIIGIILLLQLFNLQIIHGKEYRQTSSNRLTRQTTIKAARGNILDRSGNILAGTKTLFTVELYKSKIENYTLNNTILEVTNILEKNLDKYKDTFPIKVNPFEFTLTNQEEIDKWLENNKIDKKLTIEEIFNLYKKKYKIENSDLENVRKIIGMRYQIEKEGYSVTKAYIISEEISRQSALEIEEKSGELPGITIATSPIRAYNMGSLASNVIGYIGRISLEELKIRENYGNDDYIRKKWNRIRF